MEIIQAVWPQGKILSQSAVMSYCALIRLGRQDSDP